MKSYLITLGFQEGYAIRFLTSTQAQPEDKLVIVVPSPIVEGARNTLEALKAQCYVHRWPQPEVRELSISPEDPFKPISDMLNIIFSLEEPIYTDLSLGMRMMNALILLSLLFSRKKFKLFVRDEGGGTKELSFNSSEIYALLRNYSTEEAKLLAKLNSSDKGERTVEFLAKELGKSDKTVQNKISELKKLGLITQKGKSKAYELTALGKCVVEIINNVKKKDSEVAESKDGKS